MAAIDEVRIINSNYENVILFKCFPSAVKRSEDFATYFGCLHYFNLHTETKLFNNKQNLTVSYVTIPASNPSHSLGLVVYWNGPWSSVLRF